MTDDLIEWLAHNIANLALSCGIFALPLLCLMFILTLVFGIAAFLYVLSH